MGVVTMGILRAGSILVLGIVWLTASAETASAQAIVKAVYRVSMTDPATKSVFFTDRDSIRTWSTKDRCEVEKSSFSGFHTTAMRKQKVTNAEGTLLEINMVSSHCVVVSE